MVATRKCCATSYGRSYGRSPKMGKNCAACNRPSPFFTTSPTCRTFNRSRFSRAVNNVVVSSTNDAPLPPALTQTIVTSCTRRPLLTVSPRRGTPHHTHPNPLRTPGEMTRQEQRKKTSSEVRRTVCSRHGRFLSPASARYGVAFAVGGASKGAGPGAEWLGPLGPKAQTTVKEARPCFCSEVIS